ncbi:MAG: ATP-binding cassette domain-containing protein [Mycobacterium sp.]|nr:ATP-binding cassette domain-containing protein [Mycobacterium sp.]
MTAAVGHQAWPGLEVSAQLASRDLDVRFSVAPGEVLAVLGPNGAGKSTVAAVIAGIVRADEAVVRVGNRTVTDTRRGLQVPPHERRVGLLSQNPLLFPHLSVLGNVVFAARLRARSRLESRRAARSWLETVGVAELASRRPDELSGGQAQRVAIARALAAEPDVLVLDEPLAGLDVAGAAALRAVLGTVMAQGSPVILITHDLLDVLALADRVLVIEGGRVAEAGTARAVLAAPRSRFAARFAGVNLISGILVGDGTLHSAGGQIWHGLHVDETFSAGQEAVAVFSPSAVAVFRDQPHGSPRNRIRVRVDGLEVSGDVVRVRSADQPDGAPGLAADITQEAATDLRLAVGEAVWFSVKTQEVRLHPARAAQGEPAGRHD